MSSLIHPTTPTEIMISRLPHRNGVNWVFHDPIVGSVHHINVPYPHPMAQHSVNQGSQQAGTSNEMVLYQQPSNQIAQHTSQTPSAAQLMAQNSPQPASAALSMAPPPPQPAPAAGQQVDWTSKIAEVIRDQFGLRPKKQSFMYKTPYPPAYD